MSSERTTPGTRDYNCTKLANATLVFQTDATADEYSTSFTKDQNDTRVAMGYEQGSSSVQQNDSSCLSDVMQSYAEQGISAKATDIVSSWRSSTGNYTKATLVDGKHTVVREKLIQLAHLSGKLLIFWFRYLVKVWVIVLLTLPDRHCHVY